MGQRIAHCCYKYKKNLADTETKQTLQLQLLPFLVQLSKPSSPEIHQMLVSISLNISKYLKISHDISKYFKSYHLSALSLCSRRSLAPFNLQQSHLLGKASNWLTIIVIIIMMLIVMMIITIIKIINNATCLARRLIMRIWITLGIIKMLANNIIEDGYNNQHENLFSAWRPFWAPAADDEEEETVRSVGTWRDLYLQIFLIFLIFFNVFLLIFLNISKISRHLKRLMFANILSIADIFQYFLKCIILSDCVGRTWSQWKNLGKFFYSAYSSSFSS